jgi:hypothetical protein
MRATTERTVSIIGSVLTVLTQTPSVVSERSQIMQFFQWAFAHTARRHRAPHPLPPLATL